MSVRRAATDRDRWLDSRRHSAPPSAKQEPVGCMREWPRLTSASDRSVAGSQIRGLGSPTLTSGICDSHDEPGRLGPAVLVQLCAAQNPLAVASVVVERRSVHHCQSEIRDDGPPTRTPTSLSRYGERHLASHRRSDITSRLGGRANGLSGTSCHPDRWLFQAVRIRSAGQTKRTTITTHSPRSYPKYRFSSGT